MMWNNSKGNDMQKKAIKVTVAIVTFLIAVIIISLLINHGNADMTTDMEKAKYPMIYIQNDNHLINGMHAYITEMEFSHIQDSVNYIGAN